MGHKQRDNLWKLQVRYLNMFYIKLYWSFTLQVFNPKTGHLIVEKSLLCEGTQVLLSFLPYLNVISMVTKAKRDHEGILKCHWWKPGEPFKTAESELFYGPQPRVSLAGSDVISLQQTSNGLSFNKLALGKPSMFYLILFIYLTSSACEYNI